jgi:hypothetical protein
LLKHLFAFFNVFRQESLPAASGTQGCFVKAYGRVPLPKRCWRMSNLDILANHIML